MKNVFRRALIALVVLLAIFSAVFFLNPKEAPVEEPPVITVPEKDDKKDYTPYIEEYQKNKGINEDYVGKLVFDSGLIDLPVVQGATNDTYLRKNWETGVYDEFGSIFVDADNELYDQNVVIYGHMAYEYKDPTGTRMFTPLKKFTEESFYKDNSRFSFYLENEVRNYEIAAAYYCPLVRYEDFWTTPDDTAYYVPNFEESYFNVYKDSVLSKQFYDTGIALDYNSDYVTLQTCVENHDELRLIIIAKEISTEKYLSAN